MHSYTSVIWLHNLMSLLFRKAFWWRIVFQLKFFADKTIMRFIFNLSQQDWQQNGIKNWSPLGLSALTHFLCIIVSSVTSVYLVPVS